MTRTHELERDRQVADLRALLRGSNAEPPARAVDVAEDGEIDAVALEGFGDGFEPPRTAWRSRLVRQRGSIAMFLLVAVLTAAATMLVTWLLRPTPTAVPAGSGADSEAIGVDERDESSDAAPSSAVATDTDKPDNALIVVAVVGHVESPGLVTLPEGARVSDAIEAAGGALPDTDLSTINIARKVSDGEQIAVGIPGAADASSADAGPGGGDAKININSANATQLDELPGVGPVLAQSIIDFRDQSGPFATVDELANVSGIGPATLAKLSDLVTV
ncbi:ComEA family DNA-binding protein [Cumulibacter soli]|uniref:ComEA family DNA-binding protein n=1 Tax=Cumulibacter soli TaxID=2546344 RepID=UPI0010686C43|nr:ComEA family DNA-binding protein [Cumulibacter soli]